eukprot:353600-Chlamydomonas_euryale.AAC.16
MQTSVFLYPEAAPWLHAQDAALPLYDQIKPEHVVPAMRSLLAHLHSEIDALEASVTPTWAGLVQPLERIADRCLIRKGRGRAGVDERHGSSTWKGRAGVGGRHGSGSWKGRVLDHKPPTIAREWRGVGGVNVEAGVGGVNMEAGVGGVNVEAGVGGVNVEAGAAARAHR